jgi:hypothetical protein
MVILKEMSWNKDLSSMGFRNDHPIPKTFGTLLLIKEGI